ncbi:hypothetical protein ACFQZ2_08290, partial [Streptomonospora algeriensis]
MATVSEWVAGARPRTLPNSIVPVAVGTGVAVGAGGAVWWKALLAAGVALALQVGVNYANDYSDGIRGTDTEERVGPTLHARVRSCCHTSATRVSRSSGVP